MARKVITHTFRSLPQALLGFAESPYSADHVDALTVSVNRAYLALASLDDALAEKRDSKVQMTALRVALARVASERVEHVKRVSADAATFRLPGPSKDPAMDAELRAWVRAQPLDEQMNALMHPAAREAFARFPVPDKAAEHARELHRRAMEAAQPEAAKALEERESATFWADTAVQAFREHLDAMSARHQLAHALEVEGV